MRCPAAVEAAPSPRKGGACYHTANQPYSIAAIELFPMSFFGAIRVGLQFTVCTEEKSR